MQFSRYLLTDLQSNFELEFRSKKLEVETSKKLDEEYVLKKKVHCHEVITSYKTWYLTTASGDKK